MTDRIIAALGRLGMDSWLINAVEKHSFELFTVRHTEDMRRAKQVSEVSVTVFREFDGFRGSSGVMVTPDMSDAEIEARLRNAGISAGYVKNPAYKPAEAHRAEYRKECPDLQESALRMKAALYECDTDGTAFINSSEIFAEKDVIRIRSSGGTDVCYDTFRLHGEFVVQCTSPEDVELYYDFEYSEPDTSALKQLANEALTAVRDRAGAKSAPAAGQYDILLTRRHLETLLGAYLEKSDASLIYPHYSDFCTGYAAQGAEVRGEKLNMTMFSKAPVSNDGIPMPERTLLEAGEVRSLHGSTRFCRYLGIEPCGSYDGIRVSNGSVPIAELREGTLMPVAFSDFQADPLTGTFGGEIRLAYLYKDGKKQVLTGGSISGSITEAQTDYTFSKERFTSSSYDGPCAVLLKGINVAGEE